MNGLAPRLEGALVVLEPLEEAHREPLWVAAQAPEIWEWLAHLGSNRALFDRWFDLGLTAAEEGSEGVFATRRRRDDQLVGSTRYMNVRSEHRGLEIGWTWLTPDAWRSGVNVEAKLLMLGHAFEELGCLRVELKTDARNRRSRDAIEAIPARFEGVLRRHMIFPDVGIRDSAYFSVIEDEWPGVRVNLARRLSRAAP
jgi:RimJ/RimL family protein N-acetyltransferase